MLLAIINAFDSSLLPEPCFQTDESENKTDIFLSLEQLFSMIKANCHWKSWFN